MSYFWISVLTLIAQQGKEYEDKNMILKRGLNSSQGFQILLEVKISRLTETVKYQIFFFFSCVHVKTMLPSDPLRLRSPLGLRLRSPVRGTKTGGRSRHECMDDLSPSPT